MLVVDPYVLDKQVDRFRKGKRTLGAVCAHYNVPLDEAHASHADALAAARVAWRLGQAFEELRALELRALHEQQIAWAAAQAASFEDYLRRNGRDERIEPAWPIVPLRDELAPLPLAAMKRLVNDGVLPKGPAELAARVGADLAAVRNSADAAEGVRAFKEKRRPRYQGR
jgi:enoyl-CoA hydratase/carnithine racemase